MIMRQEPSDSDFDISFAGWDPYIVAMVRGSANEPLPGDAEAATRSSARSRELELMAWLRDQGGDQGSAG